MKEFNKIAFISTINGVGGSELLWKKAAEYALDKGYKVFISVADLPDVKGYTNELIKKGAIVNYRFAKLYAGTGIFKKVFFKLRQYFFNQNRFKALIKFSPDVVVINGDATGVLFMPDLLFTIKKLNKLYIHISHGGGGFFSKELINLGRNYFNNASKVCFVANRSKEFVEMSIAQKINNSLIIRNPVNFENINIIDYPSFESGIKMACVSRLNLHTKCLHHLLETLAIPEIKDIAWTLNIYGDGEHYETLESLIEYFGLNEKVFLKGHSSDIRKIWEEHHIYLIPSCTESAPISLVEAMICGRPSVVTNVGGILEWIDEEKEGFISETANPWLLKNTILKAFANKNNWKKMGENAHKKAVEMMGEPVEDFFKIIEPCI